MEQGQALPVVLPLYFERYAEYKTALLHEENYNRNVGIIVTLPTFNETHCDLAVQSIIKNNYPGCEVAVIVLVNQSTNASRNSIEKNKETVNKLQNLKPPSWVTIHLLNVFLPEKKSGVGLARKIVMDEAARWFSALENKGTIICFDADCYCNPSFLNKIKKHFELGAEAGISFYEHPLTNNGIILYETYLRYYIDGLRFAGFPYAHQTLGSCIAVRADIYMKFGGMNTRKAGEDFYFLNKIIPFCNFQEFNDVTIYPAPRKSNRVPFGTGQSILKIETQKDWRFYHPRIFHELKVLFDQIKRRSLDLTTLPDAVNNFIDSYPFMEMIERVDRISKTKIQFEKNFFNAFDAFKVLKFTHFCRDKYHASVSSYQAVCELDSCLWKMNLKELDQIERLHKIRNWDRNFIKDHKC